MRIYEGDGTEPWKCIMTFSPPPLLVYVTYLFHRDFFLPLFQ